MRKRGVERTSSRLTKSLILLSTHDIQAVWLSPTDFASDPVMARRTKTKTNGLEKSESENEVSG